MIAHKSKGLTARDPTSICTTRTALETAFISREASHAVMDTIYYSSSEINDSEPHSFFHYHYRRYHHHYHYYQPHHHHHLSA
jgi:hypothetical protein